MMPLCSRRSIRSFTVDRERLRLRASSAMEQRALRRSRLRRRLSVSSVIISAGFPWFWPYLLFSIVNLIVQSALFGA